MLIENMIGIVAAAGFGLVFGSAINALVWRLKVGKSWVKGRSQCPDCGHQLAAKDLVPVFSWLALGGKCRYCRKPIQDHPVVELMTGLLFAISYATLLPVTVAGWAALAVWLLIVVMLVALAAYDARWMLLPDKIMVPLAVVAAVRVGVLAVYHHSWHMVLTAVAAAVLGGGSFMLISLATKGRAMGGGDIKLAAVMGLLLGAKGLALAMLVSFNVAAVAGILMIALKRRRHKDQIPFGPYLVLGTVVAFLWTGPIVGWYLSINGL